MVFEFRCVENGNGELFLFGGFFCIWLGYVGL